MKANTLILALLGAILVVALASVKRQEEPFEDLNYGTIIILSVFGFVALIFLFLFISLKRAGNL
jgi:hypothetical protein